MELRNETNDLVAWRTAFVAQRNILIAHLADALVNGNDDAHRRATDCARQLDEAGLNVDDDIDTFVIVNLGHAPAWAWKPPAVRKAEDDDTSVPF